MKILEVDSQPNCCLVCLSIITYSEYGTHLLFLKDLIKKMVRMNMKLLVNLPLIAVRSFLPSCKTLIDYHVYFFYIWLLLLNLLIFM